MTTTRILDLNIWNYNDPWPVRRDLIVRLILETNPDIVAFQEVRYQDWIDVHHQADQILSHLDGYTAVWNPAAYWSPDQDENKGQQWEGLAILSRHPLVDRRIARLERDAADPHNHFPRLVLAAQIRLPAGLFWLFNTHFPLSAQARERVAPVALNFITQTAGNLPFVFTGDFNAVPAELPIQYFTGQAQIDGQSGDLCDAWTLCHPDQDGYTFSAWEPEKRIDYLFVSPNVQVQTIEIVGRTPHRETTSPSDHCGLFAAIEI
ncbi:MAG: endonuclease/exonuclease/phosphatase family protein [Anaerolineae bacterium]|nr:endonuclease/exonuclease/phosphatase family protein [Anaerolineae bacterium]